MPRTYNRGTPDERFFARVLKGDGCWEWQGYRRLRRGRTTGPGKFAIAPKQVVLAHRYAYEFWVGPIPDGMIVHHLCENPPCVNPDHLMLKAHGQHVRDHALRGGVKNQYGESWPIARSAKERRIRNRDWMRAKRARMRQGAPE